MRLTETVRYCRQCGEAAAVMGRSVAVNMWRRVVGSVVSAAVLSGSLAMAAQPAAAAGDTLVFAVQPGTQLSSGALTINKLEVYRSSNGTYYPVTR